MLLFCHMRAYASIVKAELRLGASGGLPGSAGPTVHANRSAKKPDDLVPQGAIGSIASGNMLWSVVRGRYAAPQNEVLWDKTEEPKAATKEQPSV
jgi:hypothetical protein